MPSFFNQIFYITIIVCCILAIIILLTIYGLSVQKISTTISGVYPPIQNNCPDFWDSDISGNCIIPPVGGFNTGSLYNNKLTPTDISGNIFGFTTPSPTDTNGGTINFSDIHWQGKTCNQKLWAGTYNIYWDGVTNYNGTC